MKKIIFVILLTLVFFLGEYFIYNLCGNLFHPNLIVLLLIFLHVRIGFSYSLLAAFVGGVLKDSFSAGPWGSYLFTFVVCTFFITLLKSFLYQKGYAFSRLTMSASLSLVSVGLVYWLYLNKGVLNTPQNFNHILLSEVLSTTFLSFFTFHRLKQCALQLFV